MECVSILRTSEPANRAGESRAGRILTALPRSSGGVHYSSPPTSTSAPGEAGLEPPASSGSASGTESSSIPPSVDRGRDESLSKFMPSPGVSSSSSNLGFLLTHNRTMVH